MLELRRKALMCTFKQRAITPSKTIESQKPDNIADIQSVKVW